MIKVGARASKLSQVQTKEVLEELRKYHPEISFESVFIPTSGDIDQTTSLRTLGKTDFFTKELDQMLLEGTCRITIHSAKDLPEPLPDGLAVAALTQGVDSSDVLVLSPQGSLSSLPTGSVIATSSERREDAVRVLRSDLKFVDIRGTIEQRLKQLEEGQVDGVVIAEAALIRLGLTHLNRIPLPGPTTPLQGRLAILCQKDDLEMMQVFAPIDSRKKVLYLGLDLPSAPIDTHYIHCPIIKIVPKPPEVLRPFGTGEKYTHLLFTSKSSVRLFFESLPELGLSLERLKDKQIVAVGKKTAELIQSYNLDVHTIAQEESSEGLIEEFKKINLSEASFFWPHSSLSRSLLLDFFKQSGIACDALVLYETVSNKSVQPPSLDGVDEIFFTSPSTIDAFLEAYGTIPKDKILKTIGPITKQRLELQK